MEALIEYANRLIDRSQDLEKKLVHMLPETIRNAAEVGVIRGTVQVITHQISKALKPDPSKDHKMISCK